MTAGIQKPHACGPVVHAECGRLSVLLPLLEADMQEGFINEELLPRLCLHCGTTWVIDLSEYEGGATLALAGMLARLDEEARWRGCVMEFSGMNRAVVH